MRYAPALFLFLALSSFAAEHRGIVRSHGLPIPGATVTARKGEQHLATSTDEAGAYSFRDLPEGVWKFEVEMPGFLPALQESTVIAGAPPLEFDIALGTAPPKPVVAAAAKPAAAVAEAKPAEAAKPSVRQRTTAEAKPAGGAGRFQQLAVNQNAVDSEIQQAMTAQPADMGGGDATQNANESFLVSGTLSRGLGEVGRDDGMGRGDFGDRGSMMGGGFGGDRGSMGGDRGSMMGGGGGFSGRGGPGGMMGGGGFSGRGGPGGFSGRSSGGDRGSRTPGGTRGSYFGNRSSRARDSIRGGASFSLRNSALDAKPYSISGQNIAKPSYAQSRFSVMAGGTLNIPKVVRDDKTFFFFNYSGSRSRNPTDFTSTMPSALERAGDFSQSYKVGAIYDRLSGLPFANNAIPLSRQDTAARGLITLIPLPNQPGQLQNYQVVTSRPSNSDNIGIRAGRNFTRKDRLSGSYNTQKRNASSTQLMGFLDSSDGRGISSDVSWSHTIAAGVVNNLRFSFSRNRNTSTPFFAYGRDWARELGIRGTSSDPRNFGPPNISFTNFGSLSDGITSQSASQTTGISNGLTRVWKKHNFSMGGDLRKLQTNNLSQSNGRGSMAFSGTLTSQYDASGFPVANTGFDFADFLLGYPQSSSIRFGNPDTYFRGTNYSAYFVDDFRVRTNLTLNLGARYEVVNPLVEKYNRMSNLDIAPGFTAVAPVTPEGVAPYSVRAPRGLVDADKNNVSPRIGLAWRPFAKRRVQVRSGYGWYYNGSLSNQAAMRLAQQPPYAQTASLVTSVANPLTLQSGFATKPTAAITNTFAVDRYYRTGYAQTWNFAVQSDLPHSMTIEVGYLGTKGTRLDIQRLPNRAAAGSPLTAEDRRVISNATGFTYESSEGNSIFHASQVRLSRRFRSGVSGNLLYTYGKSLDNASTFGGGGNTVAQNDKDLHAERGLSSFDRRHSLSAGYMLSTSSTRGGSSVTGRMQSALLKDWTLSGNISVRSGSPYTAQVLGNRSDQGGTGSVGSGRADATGLPLESDTGFFNLAAFTVPPAGRFGNAARNTIHGPTYFAMNMSFGRNIRLKDNRRSIDLRAEANNVLNDVNVSRIGTVVNSRTYGVALDTANMRSMSLNLRLRF